MENGTEKKERERESYVHVDWDSELLHEALQIPDGYHEEVYIRDGKVFYSNPLTYGTHTQDVKHDPEYMGDIGSVSFDREMFFNLLDYDSRTSKGTCIGKYCFVSGKEIGNRCNHEHEFAELLASITTGDWIGEYPELVEKIEEKVERDLSPS